MRDHKGISRAEDTREKHSSVTDDNRKKPMRRRYINVMMKPQLLLKSL